MPEEIQPDPQNKSTRTYEDWKASLVRIIEAKDPSIIERKMCNDAQLRIFYDQGLMPTVAFNQLFNK